MTSHENPLRPLRHTIYCTYPICFCSVFTIAWRIRDWIEFGWEYFLGPDFILDVLWYMNVLLFTGRGKVFLEISVRQGLNSSTGTWKFCQVIGENKRVVSISLVLHWREQKVFIPKSNVPDALVKELRRRRFSLLELTRVHELSESIFQNVAFEN